jgi:hypothetical protein
MERNGYQIAPFADLSGANLSGADLRGANLHGANLSGADLSGANLSGADLRGANLHGANLYGANLYGANLRGANLSGADLRGANLSGANLYGANLHGANLYGANLHGANLNDKTKLDDHTLAQTFIVPEVGAFDGWKKCQDGVLVRVRIPENARRSNATGRKCRAEFVDVIEIVGPRGGERTEAVSIHDGKTVYRVGERVTCDTWCTDRFTECAGGIHFFLTKLEAQNYN